MRVPKTVEQNRRPGDRRTYDFSKTLSGRRPPVVQMSAGIEKGISTRKTQRDTPSYRGERWVGPMGLDKEEGVRSDGQGIEQDNQRRIYKDFKEGVELSLKLGKNECHRRKTGSPRDQNRRYGEKSL